MADIKKPIRLWEEERNRVIQGDVNLDLDVTESEFDELGREHGSVAVFVADRKRFLKANGYKITRENLTNVELPSKGGDVDEEQE
jgi:hypothetical protein